MIEITSSNDYRCIAELNETVQNWHSHNYPDIFKPYDNEKAEQFFSKILGNPDNIAFLARDNNKPVGYILMIKIKLEENEFQYERTIFQLDQIVVAENSRNLGVGEKLINAAVSFVKTSGIEIIELNHWSNNTQASSFFKKNGFQYFNQKMTLTLASE